MSPAAPEPGTQPDPRAVRAAAANVAWCDTVCRARGIPGSVRSGVWRAGGEPPPFYPDVVTLRPGLTPPDVAGAVSDRQRASVKDSFGDVDLGRHGFEVLFEGEWIWQDAASPAVPAPRPTPVPGLSPDAELVWGEVVDDAALGEWAAASGQAGTFSPGLLADPAVRFFTARAGGEVVGRAALCLGAGVVGVSNVWSGVPEVWESLGGAASELFPGRPVAGYEHGRDLAEAVAAGFEPIGPLRVWVRR